MQEEVLRVLYSRGTICTYIYDNPTMQFRPSVIALRPTTSARVLRYSNSILILIRLLRHTVTLAQQYIVFATKTGNMLHVVSRNEAEDNR
jgi:hypothetical protein